MVASQDVPTWRERQALAGKLPVAPISGKLPSGTSA